MKTVGNIVKEAIKAHVIDLKIKFKSDTCNWAPKWSLACYITNHNYYNYLNCDWYMNCSILLVLIFEVVIGQLAVTDSCMSQSFYVRSTKSTNQNTDYNHYSNQLKWLLKFWRFSLRWLFWKELNILHILNYDI